MPKHNPKRENNIESLLREDVCFNLSISNMNWSALVANEDVEMHYEVYIQLFYGDSKPLSNRTMIPLVRERVAKANESIHWVFLQIPMQALITSDLALCFEVYKVTKKYGDIEPIRCLGETKGCSLVKTLEGWSFINLSATYALSNMMEGQSYNFHKLRIFEIGRMDRKIKVTDNF